MDTKKGIKLGTNVDPKNSALQLISKLEKVLTSKLRHCGNQLGDTLTVNSIVLSTSIFKVRLEFHPKSLYKKIDILAKRFIRNTGYLIRDSQRYATPRDGALVTLISMTKLAITLQAKWFYKIIHANTLKDTPIFTPKVLVILYPTHITKIQVHVTRSSNNVLYQL